VNIPRRLVPHAVLIAIAASACRPSAPAPLSEADRAAMRRTIEPVLAMLTSPNPDWQKFVSIYAEDAVVMPGGARPFIGHDSILVLLHNLPVFAEYKQTSDRLEGSGNLAYQIWTYIARVEEPNKPAVVDTGKDVFVWRKEADGNWKVVIEIWNSIMPQPTAAP
jgi:ketosteroid isomerase-like protein